MLIAKQIFKRTLKDSRVFVVNLPKTHNLKIVPFVVSAVN